MPPPGIEPATPCFPVCLSNHSAIDVLLELLQYFLKKRYYKNYVSCARDIKNIKINDHCSLTVFRLKPFKYKMIYTKEEFFMSYMSMTTYNIYFFLFIIVYIVCIIIYLLILYVVFAKAKGNNSYKLVVHVKSCRGSPYLTPFKNGIFYC